MKIDIKYYAALIVGIMGVWLTIWYANVPPKSKSLSLDVESQNLLNTEKSSEIPGLKVFVDQREITDPAITVLTIYNSGTTPIRSDDFESDIEVIFDGESKLIRASVIETKPEWLKPSVYVEKSMAFLKPILLNPRESITISLISQGLPSSISSRSRIAGIEEITITKSKNNQVISYFKLILAFIVAIPLAAIYPPSNGLMRSIPKLNRKMSILIAFILITLISNLVLEAIAKIFGEESFWLSMVTSMGVLLLALPVAARLNKQHEENEVENET